jgi:oligoendopeptidase F
MIIPMKKMRCIFMKRNEIPEQYKWKMEDLYASNDAWETDFLKLTKGLED